VNDEMVKPSPSNVRRDQLLELYGAWKSLRDSEILSNNKLTELKALLEAQLQAEQSRVRENSELRSPLQVRIHRSIMHLLGVEAEDAEAPYEEEVGDVQALLEEVNTFHLRHP